MEVVVTVEIQDGDECPQFGRTVEAEATGETLRDVIEAVNETGDAGQIYLVRLIQKGNAGETTLQTQRVIPEHKAYSLTLQEVSGGLLLVAHPTHTAHQLRRWRDVRV